MPDKLYNPDLDTEQYIPSSNGSPFFFPAVKLQKHSSIPKSQSESPSHRFRSGKMHVLVVCVLVTGQRNPSLVVLESRRVAVIMSENGSLNDLFSIVFRAISSRHRLQCSREKFRSIIISRPHSFNKPNFVMFHFGRIFSFSYTYWL